MKKIGKVKLPGKAAGLAGISLMALLLLIYTGFSLFFNNHFYFGTRMESIECSLATAEGAREKIKNEAGSYSLEIIGRNGVSEQISDEEIGLSYVFDDSLNKLIEEQNGFLWPKFLFQSNQIENPVKIEYSEEALKDLFDQFSFFDQTVLTEPQNAYIGKFDHTSQSFPIIAETKGTVLNKELTYEKLKEAISRLERQINLEELGCYSLPEITADSPALRREQELLNKIAGLEITYRFDDATEVVDGGLIMDWLVWDQDGTYTLDPVLVKEYVDGLARKYDTFGQTREFRTTGGEVISLRGGSYGWWMNRPGEAQELLERIEAGESGPKEVNYYGRAVKYGADDIGDSYVEIDLSAQHLYLYLDGQIHLESDFVSGSIASGYGTPAGVYGLTYKERNATLRGENYATPVKYWMPFNGNIGMHDAGWRESFGGDIFIRNGSHGCINLPPRAAEEIYAYVDKGFPVILYGEYTGPILPPDTAPDLQELNPDMPGGEMPPIVGEDMLPQSPPNPPIDMEEPLLPVTGAPEGETPPVPPDEAVIPVSAAEDALQ